MYRIAAGGMWADDAFREIEDRLLQGQQPHRSGSACVLHIPRLHISTEEGTEQAQPALHQFPAGCEQGCLEEDATDSAGVATKSTDSCGASCTGDAIQPNHPRGVELLRGVLSATHV